MGQPAEEAFAPPAPERPAVNLLDLPGRLWEALPAAVYVCGADGAILRYNGRAAELWGRAPALGETAERYCGSHRMYRLDGALLPHAECPMADVLRTGVPVHDQEVVIERPDGSRIVALVNIEAIADGAGRIAGAVNWFSDVTARSQAETTLRRNEERLSRKLAAMQRLQAVSTALIQEGDVEALHRQIVDAAADLMRSEMASLQMLHPERGELRLLAHKGFHPDSAAFWEWVNLESESTCGAALSSGERIVVPDVETCDFMAGTADLDAYRRSSIRAVQSTPLVSRSGRLLGMISTHWRTPYRPKERDLALLDVLARQAADLIERTWAERDAHRLAAIVESSEDAIVSKNLDGVIETWNQGAERLFGYTSAEAVGKPITMLIPPDRQDEEVTILARIRRGERIEHFETVRRRKDGRLIDISLTISPVRNAEGKIVAASKIARDIADRKQAEQQQALLLREMGHRINNLFALAGGMVTMSARFARTPEELSSAILGRLGALSRAHGLARPGPAAAADEAGQETGLHALVRAIFAPYLDAADGRERLICDGPEVAVGRDAHATVALVLHELATNAAKYGALSAPAGLVRIDWTIDDGALSLRWREEGGPALSGPPGHEGFGSTLARGGVTSQLGGSLSHDWRPEGLTIHLSIPLARLSPRA